MRSLVAPLLWVNQHSTLYHGVLKMLLIPRLCFVSFSWGILFSHPADYTPVCTTELGMAAKMAKEFQKRGVKMIALSIDSVESHEGWIKVGVRCESMVVADIFI